MELRWITITTLLLAIGVILRMVSPNIGGISLNWNIVMYCLAILLCRPTIKQGFWHWFSFRYHRYDDI